MGEVDSLNAEGYFIRYFLLVRRWGGGAQPPFRAEALESYNEVQVCHAPVSGDSRKHI